MSDRRHLPKVTAVMADGGSRRANVLRPNAKSSETIQCYVRWLRVGPSDLIRCYVRRLNKAVGHKTFQQGQKIHIFLFISYIYRQNTDFIYT